MRRSLPLILLPLLFISLAFNFHLERGPQFLNAIDPEYAIIYNGLLIAIGEFDIKFIDHPATPTILISGIASTIRGFFLNGEELINHFIQHPEGYIKRAHLFQLILIAISSFIAGKLILRWSGSALLAIFCLSTFFMNQYIFDIGSRLIPESTMLIPLILIIALGIKYIFDKDSEKNPGPYLWQFPLIIALGVACKLSFSTFLLFPFILIKSTFKQKLGLLLYFLIFLLIFAYPLFTNLGRSTDWILGILKHSGLHGGGEENFVSFAEWPIRMLKLYLMDPLFWILAGLNILILIVAISSKRPKSNFQRKCLRFVFASLMGLTITSLFILKHFSQHYLMPFLLFKALFLILPILYFNSFRDSFPQTVFNRFSAYTISLIIVSVCLWEFNSSKDFQSYQMELSAERQNVALQLLEKIKDDDHLLIIEPNYWGSPFIENAHHFGFSLVHENHPYFKEQLKKEFPNFYLKVGWSSHLIQFGDYWKFNSLLSPSKAIYVYNGIGKNSLENIEKELEQFAQINSISVQKQTLYSDETGRRFIRFDLSTK